MNEYIKRSVFVLLILFAGSFRSNAIAYDNLPSLSDKAEIFLLTCSPGTELYALFGHTAIWVYDSTNRIDAVFNYGTFDFNTPYFYPKYASGLLEYNLSISTFEVFLNSYRNSKRNVYSQKLKLLEREKQKLFDALLTNYRPENRSYRYNFLYDNCSTRVRDIIENSLIRPVKQSRLPEGRSYWSHLDDCLRISPWIQWGIHTILGQRGNRTAGPKEAAFLPHNLMTYMEHMQAGGENLTGPSREILSFENTAPLIPVYERPAFIFSAILLTIAVLLFLWKKTTGVVSSVVLFASGLIGLLIVFLGFFTLHPMTAPNYNILWANPTNLILPFFIFRKQNLRWVKILLKINLCISLTAIPLWFILRPATILSGLPLIALTSLCIYTVLRKYFHKKIQNINKTTENEKRRN